MKATIEQLSGMLTRNVVQAEAELAKWQAKFTEDPLYALEWVGQAEAAAAKRHVAQDLLAGLAGMASEDISDEERWSRLEAEALQRVVWGAQAASAESAKREVARQWAEMYDRYLRSNK